MSPAQSFVTRCPVLTYFALALGISRVGGLFVLGPSRIPITLAPHEDRASHVRVRGDARRPSVAGLLMTSLVSGRAGLRKLLARLTTWREGGRWYAVALLAPPLTVMAVSLALSFLSPDFLPAIFITNEKPAVLSRVVAGLIAGIFGELGWTGLQAFPRPAARFAFGGLGWQARSERADCRERDDYNLAEMFARLDIQPAAPPQPAEARRGIDRQGA